VKETVLVFVFLVMASVCNADGAGGSNSTIVGHTLFPELSAAAVTVRVGSESYLATTNAAGVYNLQVSTPEADDLIVVEVQGTGSQAHLRYSRLVGRWSDLDTENVGADPVTLGPAMPLSTALYVLVEARTGGSLPQAFSTVEPLTRTLDTRDTNWMMFVMSAIEKGLIGIGEGSDNTLDLLRDPELIIDRIRQLTESEALWDQALEAMYEHFEDPRMYRLRGSLPGILETIEPQLDRGADRILIEFDENGQAGLGRRYYGGAVELISGGAIWADRFQLESLDGREWEFGPAEGTDVEIRAGEVWVWPEGELIPFRDTLHRLIWRSFDASAVFNLVDKQVIQLRSYPDNPERPPSTSTSRIPNQIVMGIRRDRLPDEWAGPQPQSVWSLPLCVYDFSHEDGPAHLGAFGYDFITFNADGSASARRAQLDLQWSFQGTDLLLTAENMPETRLRFVGKAARADLVAASCQKSSNELRAVTAWAHPVQAVADFTKLELPLRFVSGWRLDRYLPFMLVRPESTIIIDFWVIELYSDGTGKAGFIVNPSDPSSSPSGYSLEWEQSADGRVEIHMEHPCCGWVQSRSWLPIAVEGGEIQLIESLFLAPREELDGELEQPGRYNWYRMIDLPAVP